MVFAVLGSACSGDSAGSPSTASETLEGIDNRTGQQDVSQIVDHLRPSVVQVQAGGATLNMFGQPLPQGEIGTGFVFDDEGYIVTNNHVVRAGASSVPPNITVALNDDRRLPAEVVGVDQFTGLAVLKVDADNLTPVALATSEEPRVGEFVIAIGHALELEGGPTVSAGVVSATNSSLYGEEGLTRFGLIQTDAAINPGDSGGPLVNIEGNVIGVNVAYLASSAIDGIGFAISIRKATPLIEEMAAIDKAERGVLGSTSETSEFVAAMVSRQAWNIIV
jgi:S1-C subfamily serine protease